VPRTNVEIGNLPATQTIAPTHLSMPSLSISMDVVPVGVDSSGDLVIPSDSDQAGWYQFGPGLFEPAGSVVLASHIDSWNGIGPFSQIKDAAAGASIVLTAGDRSETFTVTQVQQAPKAGENMASIFSTTGPPHLTMVTCGGVFNNSTGHYADNVILTADPAP
jgi:hypothetical protein